MKIARRRSVKIAAFSSTMAAMQTQEFPRPRWEPGFFQIHFVHTGVGESLFFVFPDGTSMLLDCGDHAAITRGVHAVPAVPGPERLAGEWVARYVEKANPRGRDVDWIVVSHFHSDHAGTSYWQKTPRVPAPFPGGPEEPKALGGCARSGIGLAAETLRFSRATDRAWPFYEGQERMPTTEESREVAAHVRATWSALHRRDGLVPEPFRLGATDQFAPLHGSAPGFSVRNVCANGCIAMPDGTVRDLYAGAISQGVFAGRELNENAMSLGMVFSLGRFRFAACGDFSDRFAMPDGREVFIEDDLAGAVGRVDVAKIDHHGHHSGGRRLAAALDPRVWIAPVWDNLHCTDDTMESLLAGKEPVDALVVPTVLPVRFDGERPWWRFVPDACRTGVHAVVTVRPDGESYALDLLDARTEDAPALAHFDFETSPKK